MPGSYKDFQPEAEANTAPPPIGTGPEGNFPGKFVNNILRNVMAAVRNLGDGTLKIDADKGMTGDTRAGTAALRDESFFVTRGSGATGFGIVPIGGVVALWGTQEYAESLLSSGFAICDGRIVTDPATGAAIQMPDFRGSYWRSVGTGNGPMQTSGANIATTTAGGGGHTHSATTDAGGSGTTGSGGSGTTGSGGSGTTGSGGSGTTGSGGGVAAGTTGGTALTASHLPATTYVTNAFPTGTPANGEAKQLAFEDGDQAIQNDKLTGGGQAHAHSVPAIPAHTHTIPAHTHSLSGHTHTIPAHTHSLPDHTHAVTISESGEHTHQISLFPRASNFWPMMRIA